MTAGLHAAMENRIMKIVTGSNGTKYQVINGTSFHMETDNAVIQVLCDALDTRGHGRSSRRLRLYYGDVETGRDWEEVYEVTGYIGRSTGRNHQYYQEYKSGY